ncbi:hypothetical protein E9549_05540 [Blastococcus sp. MG754426]|uniref:hypothetical protein n=1 Tax=unclassified Blastococcus TaxID=2619396 RepID=UPI001EEFCC91|nr:MULTISPECIES: hypothetical protein [unclassified Blastococcus]MCF6506869.1 hypothetical protein [Blastococcus sp. MG754426]MCF6511669.1 hypothetical protein [Blastococcus sp. MG754427]
MSGSSGPDLTPGSGAGDGGGDCLDLRLSRWLEGPVPGVADHLPVGDVLTVQLQDGSPVIVALITAGGQIAGSVVPTGRLLTCLRQGVPFLAHVRSAVGGAIQVEIRAAAR